MPWLAGKPLFGIHLARLRQPSLLHRYTSSKAPSSSSSSSSSSSATRRAFPSAASAASPTSSSTLRLERFIAAFAFAAALASAAQIRQSPCASALPLGPRTATLLQSTFLHTVLIEPSFGRGPGRCRCRRMCSRMRPAASSSLAAAATGCRRTSATASAGAAAAAATGGSRLHWRGRCVRRTKAGSDAAGRTRSLDGADCT